MGQQKKRPTRQKRDVERRSNFLKSLMQGASVTKACDLSGLARQTVYRWRDTLKGWAEAWDEAESAGTDRLEDEAYRRACEGSDKPVYQKGAMVGTIREYSDTLMIFLLKARRPDKFKDRIQQEHTGPDGKPLPAAQQNTVVLTDLQGKSLDELTLLFTEKMKGGQ